MKSLLVVVMIALLSACDQTSPSSMPVPARYVRPDFVALLSGVKASAEVGVDVETVREEARGYWTQPAAQALWSGVKRAEECGLAEMYGVEIFPVGETGYEAVFFVRTTEDRIHCLLAKEGYQASRTDLQSVPALPVERGDFDRLRQRVSVELPLEQEVELAVDAGNGAIYLLHIYRGGESHHALWYEPHTSWEPYQDAARTFAHTYPVAAILNAIHAAVPAEQLPSSDVAGWYDQTPDYPAPHGGK